MNSSNNVKVTDQKSQENERLADAGKWKGRKQNPNDFLEARNGDHLLTPFECDLCIFRKLRKQSPIQNNAKDKLLLLMIRQMNLDAFWS